MKKGKYDIGIHNASNGDMCEVVGKINSDRREVGFIEDDTESFVFRRVLGLSSFVNSNNNKYKYEVGSIHPTKSGINIMVIEKLKRGYRIVKFMDSTNYKVRVGVKYIFKGNIKNPYHPSVCGVGYYGVGDYKGIDETGKSGTMYTCWRDMIFRCYRYSEKNINYVNVTVCEEWLNFQNFAKFYTDTKPIIDDIEFRLDKDLMQIGVENKIYSPATTVWIPKEINSFLTNNQPNHNTSGYTGVSENTNKKGYWRAQINDYDTGKYICIKSNCETKEEAYELYKEYRAKNAEKVKVYLRSLNYLSEDVIQLIK